MGFAVMTGKWIPPRKPKDFDSPIFGLTNVEIVVLNLRSAKEFNRWLGRVIGWAEYKKNKKSTGF